jgi:hypothetical protein
LIKIHEVDDDDDDDITAAMVTAAREPETESESGVPLPLRPRFSAGRALGGRGARDALGRALPGRPWRTAEVRRGGSGSGRDRALARLLSDIRALETPLYDVDDSDRIGTCGRGGGAAAAPPAPSPASDTVSMECARLVAADAVIGRRGGFRLLAVAGAGPADVVVVEEEDWADGCVLDGGGWEEPLPVKRIGSRADKDAETLLLPVGTGPLADRRGVAEPPLFDRCVWSCCAMPLWWWSRWSR